MIKTIQLFITSLIISKMIKAKNVYKYFGNHCVVSNASFDIGVGEIIGFLGQNGAGKTTLMRMLTTFLIPTTGSIEIFGMNTMFDSVKICRRIGYLPETPPLYKNMTVVDYLKFAASLKEIPHNQLRTKIDQVLEDCDLMNVRGKMIGILSKGFQQRVGIAQAILNDPELLILDEPTNGLDPVQILQVRKLIKTLKEKRTVILSTHILSEIEGACERVMMIKDGEVIVDETIEKLLVDKSKVKRVSFYLRGDAYLIRKELEKSGHLKIIEFSSSHSEHAVKIEFSAEFGESNEILERLLKAGCKIIHWKEEGMDLEKIFLQKNSI